MLCSPQWDQSNESEYQRYMQKWSTSFIKTLRQFKKLNPGLLPIIPDIYKETLILLGNTRTPCNMCMEDREVLAKWCSQYIRQHLMMLQNNFPDIIQSSRLRGTIVGLMYLMRSGIVAKGVVVLPRLPVLQIILPLETHLLYKFGIKGKVITETENTVKQLLKNISTAELVSYSSTNTR
jgi:hypothetical protein